MLKSELDPGFEPGTAALVGWAMCHLSWPERLTSVLLLVVVLVVVSTVVSFSRLFLLLMAVWRSWLAFVSRTLLNQMLQTQVQESFHRNDKKQWFVAKIKKHLTFF